jgi:pimeloyl-ACP methyl ester carboxylesterase
VVLIPGHGQTADSARKLIATAAALSKSKLVWAIDVDASEEGDPIKAKALSRIVRMKLATMFSSIDTSESEEEANLSVRVTVVGWSHGGGVALLAAEADSSLFHRVLALCPTGLVDREPYELLRSFALEALRIVWRGLSKIDLLYLARALEIGANILRGSVPDSLRSGSLQPLAVDIQWAAKKVVGKTYRYDGTVAFLFGRRDTVIRWRDVFPNCKNLQDLPMYFDDFKKANLPYAYRVEVQVLEGNHFAPEVDAPSFIRIGLGLLGELDMHT